MLRIERKKATSCKRVFRISGKFLALSRDITFPHYGVENGKKFLKDAERVDLDFMQMFEKKLIVPSRARSTVAPNYRVHNIYSRRKYSIEYPVYPSYYTRRRDEYLLRENRK